MPTYFPPRVVGPAKFEALIDDGVIGGLRPPAPFIDRAKPIVTMGSCFAVNVSNFLRAQNYPVALLQVSDRLFTTFALRDFVSALAADNLQDFPADWELVPEETVNVRAALREEATVIITLGLSVAWIEKKTGRMVYDPRKKMKGMLWHPRPEEYDLVQTSVEENVEACTALIDTLRSMNERLKIIFTLSPLPLVYSQDKPVVVSDALSKSTLRIALDQVMQFGYRDLYYFPSYEILKWVAPMFDQIWFEDALLSHIRKDWIDYVMGKFAQFYCGGEPPVAPIAWPGNPAAGGKL